MSRYIVLLLITSILWAQTDFEPVNILFIGDSQIDICTAKNAGMCSVGVLWGNGTEAELQNAGADIIFSEPLDLKTFLMEQMN